MRLEIPFRAFLSTSFFYAKAKRRAERGAPKSFPHDRSEATAIILLSVERSEDALVTLGLARNERSPVYERSEIGLVHAETRSARSARSVSDVVLAITSDTNTPAKAGS